MGGTMSSTQELEFIRSGGIHYEHAEILEASVRFAGTTAIVLNRIRLDAVVGGNEVTNPFVVTEVYVGKRVVVEVRLALGHQALAIIIGRLPCGRPSLGTTCPGIADSPMQCTAN